MKETLLKMINESYLHLISIITNHMQVNGGLFITRQPLKEIDYKLGHCLKVVRYTFLPARLWLN